MFINLKVHLWLTGRWCMVWTLLSVLSRAFYICRASDLQTSIQFCLSWQGCLIITMPETYNMMVFSKQISVSVRSTITMSVSKISPPSCSRQNTAQRWSSAKGMIRKNEQINEQVQLQDISIYFIQLHRFKAHFLPLKQDIIGDVNKALMPEATV